MYSRMIFASFHQGKEETIFAFLCLFMNHSTCVSRLEAAPTLFVVIVRLQFNRSNPGISSFLKFPFHPRPDWLHLYP